MRSSAAAMFSAGVGQAGVDRVGENIQSLQRRPFQEMTSGFSLNFKVAASCWSRRLCRSAWSWPWFPEYG
jgi:hypothetical protein